MKDSAEVIARLRDRGFSVEGWTVEEIQEYIMTGKGPLADAVKRVLSPKEGEK